MNQALTAPADDELGLYAHLPFCPARCPYCDFFAVRFEPKAAAGLLEAMTAHLPRLAEKASGRRLDSLYIGGGTPSMLPLAALGRLLEAVHAALGLAPDAEISLEANPGTLSLAKLRGLKALGVNRLSIGAQSFDSPTLKLLGRLHGPGDTLRCVDQARSAGFDNLNLDLIYGLPDQSPALALADVEAALALAPEHLSLYELTLARGTPFGRRFRPGEAPLPDDERLAAMEEAALERLAASPLARYEVSNFAAPGRRCRHNQSTWRGGDYLALGPGAHGHLAGVRWAYAADCAAYARDIAQGREPLAFRENLEPEQRALESIMLGLRTTEGVNLSRLGRLLGADPLAVHGRAVARLAELGWAVVRGGALRPTGRGLRMADAAAALFA